MLADNSRLIVAAARRRSAATRRRATSALRRMDATGSAITFEAVAREAGVSRSWLYNQPDLRARHRPVPAARPVADRQRASEASLLRRPEAATERNRQLEAENRDLRQALALTLGERRTADAAAAAVQGATSGEPSAGGGAPERWKWMVPSWTSGLFKFPPSTGFRVPVSPTAVVKTRPSSGMCSKATAPLWERVRTRL
ncbi:DUF6262 family protein [Kitasatospora sp. NPDC058063]|uniref:DUF6262 family protein n=1 Tax=unclassified Kitasatospora TaxID=2633591 RepID=UPI0036DB2577